MQPPQQQHLHQLLQPQQQAQHLVGILQAAGQAAGPIAALGQGNQTLRTAVSTLAQQAGVLQADAVSRVSLKPLRWVRACVCVCVRVSIWACV